MRPAPTVPGEPLELRRDSSDDHRFLGLARATLFDKQLGCQGKLASLRLRDGRRRGNITYLTWDANGMNLLAERDASGVLIAQYVHGHTPIDGIASMVAAKKTVDGVTYYQYPLYDHRGSVVRLVDENSAMIAYYEGDPWLDG